MPPTINNNISTCSKNSSNKIFSFVLTFFLVLLIIYAIIYILRTQTSNQQPIHRMNESFMQAESNNKIIGFFMDGCRYCTEFHPTFDKVIKSFKSSEKFNNTWSVTTSNNVSEAKKQYNITGYPSVVVIKNDKVVETRTGKMEEAQFKDLLNKYVQL